jgi:hypothetical protein
MPQLTNVAWFVNAQWPPWECLDLIKGTLYNVNTNIEYLHIINVIYFQSYVCKLSWQLSSKQQFKKEHDTIMEGHVAAKGTHAMLTILSSYDTNFNV